MHGKFRGNGFKTISVAIPGCKVQRYRICVGNHPEDVKKWIEDRRKKFPRQQRPVAVKENAGESQLGGLLDGYGSTSEEEEGEKPVNLESKPVSNPGTADCTLDTSRFSDGEQAKNATTTTTTSATTTTNAANYRSQTCRYFARTGTCCNGDKCTFLHERANNNSNNNNNNNAPMLTLREHHQREPKRRTMGNNNKKNGTTLLQTLLQNDARREATLTLQLLRYIVDCNFLQKTQSANSTTE